MCFALNAVSYIAVLGARTGMRVQRRPVRAPSHPLADLAEGWRYTMGTLPLRRLLLTLGAVSFAISPYTTLMPAMTVRIFGEGSELVGIFIGAVGLGALIFAVSSRGGGAWRASGDGYQSRRAPRGLAASSSARPTGRGLRGAHDVTGSASS